MEFHFLEFLQKNTLFEKTNYSMFHYSLRMRMRIIDEPKMSEIRILNLCHKKTILVDIYRQSLLKIQTDIHNMLYLMAVNDTLWGDFL